MRRFWWVNHKQTVRQEIIGEYLWSPKTEADGARSQYYDNMRLATPNDSVFSYANAKISHIGIVSDFAISAPKPIEFGKLGDNWNRQGWLLPVTWHLLPNPISPKTFIDEIRVLLPEKYSPIRPATGVGNQKAYLTEISADLFQFFLSRSGLKTQLTTSSTSSAESFIEKAETKLEDSIKNDFTLSDTEKDQLVKSRRGQGKFRTSLFEVESCCRISRINNPSLLLASHIKPWRACLTAQERLDKYNGLLLAPHVDHLFDKGFLSFTSIGTVLISSRLSMHDLSKLGLEESCKSTSGLFTPEQQSYLNYHRTEIFMT